MISATIATVASAVGTAAGGAVVSALCPEKKPPVLDPIATICMLAWRTLLSEEGAKPAVSGNFFYYDGPGLFQGLVRLPFINNTSHEDVAYVVTSIEEFIRHWESKEGSALNRIVKVAIQGLEKTKSAYNHKYPLVDRVLDDGKTFLSGWLVSSLPPAEGMHLIKHIWLEADLAKVAAILEEKGVHASRRALELDKFLAVQNGRYQGYLKLGSTPHANPAQESVVYEGAASAALPQ